MRGQRGIAKNVMRRNGRSNDGALHRTVADRVLVPDAVSEGVRLVPVWSDELAVDKTWHQDGNLAQRPLVAPESALTIGTLYNKVLH